MTDTTTAERSARIAYLDPAIVPAILAGTQPRHLTARALWLTAQRPYDWAEQRRVLRFIAA